MKGNWRSGRTESQESNCRSARSGSQKSNNTSQKSSRRRNPSDEMRKSQNVITVDQFSIGHMAYACPDACEVKEAYEDKEALKEILISKETDGVKVQ